MLDDTTYPHLGTSSTAGLATSESIVAANWIIGALTTLPTLLELTDGVIDDIPDVLVLAVLTVLAMLLRVLAGGEAAAIPGVVAPRTPLPTTPPPLPIVPPVAKPSAFSPAAEDSTGGCCMWTFRMVSGDGGGTTCVYAAYLARSSERTRSSTGPVTALATA